MVALVGPRARLDVGVDVPLDLRADPARRGVAARRAELDLLDLRRRRLAAAAADGRQASSTSTPSGTRRGCWPTAISNLKNELIDPSRPRPRPRRPPRNWPGSSPRSTREYQRRLREANALDFDDLISETVDLLQALPADRRALPAALPARPGRRVPGHQPRAVRAGPRAGRHATTEDGRCRPASCAWSVTPTSRSTRSAARRSATSWSSSATTRTPRTILLEQNYRSTQTILSAANSVIARNTERRDEAAVDRRRATAS